MIYEIFRQITKCFSFPAVRHGKVISIAVDSGAFDRTGSQLLLQDRKKHERYLPIAERAYKGKSYKRLQPIGKMSILKTMAGRNAADELCGKIRKGFEIRHRALICHIGCCFLFKCLSFTLNGCEKRKSSRYHVWGDMLMLKNDPKEIEEKWCQNIIYVCYIAVGINAVVLIAVWFMYMAQTENPISPGYYWSRYIITPTFCMLALNFCSDRLIHSRRVGLKAKKYLALCNALAFCTFLCMVHSILAVLLVTFVIPIFISTIFADCKITRCIFILSLAAQILSAAKMHFFSTRDFGSWIWFEWIVAVAILVAAYFFAETLIQEGQYHISSLKHSVQEREQLEEQLQKDGCTGLYSHASFEKIGRDIFSKCLARQIPLSFSMFDLDNFKEINDTYGHVAGDKVLQHLSRILLNNSNENILAFRLGGDEFGLLMKGFTLPNAQNVCEGIQSLFASSSLPEVDYRKITFSCGIAFLHKPEIGDITRLFRAADTTMYRAKRKGKDRIELWKTIC